MLQQRDSEIEQLLLRELRPPAEVSSKELCVFCLRGVATLKGTVENYGDRLAAQRAAERTPGVVRVVNDISVKGSIDLRLIRRPSSALAVAFLAQPLRPFLSDSAAKAQPRY